MYFLQEMQRHLDENKDTISNIVQKAETSFEAMQQLFQGFRKATTIDAEFLMWVMSGVVNNTIFQIIGLRFNNWMLLKHLTNEQSVIYM